MEKTERDPNRNSKESEKEEAEMDDDRNSFLSKAIQKRATRLKSFYRVYAEIEAEPTKRERPTPSLWDRFMGMFCSQPDHWSD